MLFTCGFTRAVSIELTKDLGNESLILALRRFLLKRGKAELIVSNNFKTFQSEDVKVFLRDNYIQWKFILESSPWWRGFHERLVRIMKPCLKKIMGTALLTFEELRTVIYEIECTLNSRPLTYVDEDFDNNILTSNHLIYERNINKKCFNDSSSEDMNKTDAQNSFQLMILVL